MKKNLLLKGMLFAIVAILFTACDNEPLEGEFLQEQDLFIEAEEGQLRAFIDGVEFISDIATAEYYPSNDLFTVRGIITSTGAVVGMGIHDDDPETIISEGTFVFETGAQESTDALYNPNNEIIESYRTNPIPASIIYNVTVTVHDTVNHTVSGTFAYNAARMEPDESGNDFLVTVSLTDGSFTNIEYTVDGEEEEEEVSGEFFAKADGVDFVPVSLTTTQNTVGDIPMVNIVATNELGDVIRIDIPEDLDEGTYDMEQISDGTVLIGLYNPETVGENLTSNPGTITILNINAFTGYIEATFSFTATDPLGNDETIVQITEGSFAVNYLPVDATIDNNLFAQIDEEPFFPTEVTVSQTIFNGVDRISMIARNENTGQTMGFFFPLDTVEGTYEMTTTLIEGDEIIALYTPVDGVSLTYTANPGTFTITDYDVDSGVIEGTFEFLAIDDLQQDETEYTITNGEFSIMLQ